MFKNLSILNKIYGAIGIWLLLCGACFGFLFPRLENSNLKTVAEKSQQSLELQNLRVEWESYKRASSDLDKLSKQNIKPDDLFGQDITLVKELEILENWAQKTGVKLTLSGIAGTVKGFSKAKTTSDIVIVPYSIGLSGSYKQVIDYIEILENVRFVTTLNSLSISTAQEGQVNASMTAYFYLKKK